MKKTINEYSNRDWIRKNATREEKIELIQRSLKRLKRGLNPRVQFDIISFTLESLKIDHENKN